MNRTLTWTRTGGRTHRVTVTEDVVMTPEMVYALGLHNSYGSNNMFIGIPTKTSFSGYWLRENGWPDLWGIDTGPANTRLGP